MSANKKTIGLTNGWILCPSKSFPGKFYYFNVLNGETAWSLNEADKKGLRQDSSIQKITDKSHDYPEPTHHPDDTSILSKYNIGTNFQRLDIKTQENSYAQQLPTFGQASFPKYVSNVEPLMPNIVWTPIQLPLPIFCSENKKLSMVDEVTQTSEVDRELFIQTCDIPLCKRFKNYETPSLYFDKKNKIVNKPIFNFASSTPKLSSKLDTKPKTQSCIPKSKSLIKEPVLKLETNVLEPKTRILSLSNNRLLNVSDRNTIEPPNNIEHTKLTLQPSHKVESTKLTLQPLHKVESTKSSEMDLKILHKGEVLENLESTDLRFLLIAKRRKSMDAAANSAVERKKSKPCAVQRTAPKKVTFDLSDSTDEDAIISEANTQKDFIPLTINHSENTNSPTNTLPLYINEEIKKQTPNENDTVFIEEQTECTRKRQDIWYIAVDTDVLLLDHEFIDELVLSDKKCKLLIPHAVRMDIQALCMGDCRGQKRVITARQLTRLLTSPPKHYIVEPVPLNTIMMTTESILNCCTQAHIDSYVVLITNDPHLQIKANSLNIPNYKLNDVKCGVNIKPDTFTKHNENKISLNDGDDSRQNKTKKIFNNGNNLNPIHTVQELKTKLKFLAEETDKIMLDMDKLYNITKPKSPKYKETATYDSDSTTSDISREVHKLELKDKNLFTPRNDNRYPYFPEINKNNVRDGFINFEKNIQNPNAFLNLEKTIPNLKRELQNFQKITKQKNDHTFQNEILKKNLQSNEKVCCSIPITNIIKPSQCQNKSYFENAKPKPAETSGIPGYSSMSNMCTSRHDTESLSKESQTLSATQSRIKKMLGSINNNVPVNQNQTLNSNDPTGLFKIPQPVQFKNRNKNSSSFIATNAKVQTYEFKNIDSSEECQRRFCIKSKIIRDKINARIDEWSCTYTQIMEDFLSHLLQRNSACMKDTVAPLTLHDTLNCIKLLYGNHTKIRDAVDNLAEMLNKCTLKQGNFKLFLQPDDFMSIFGYGVFLIHALKAILPESNELKDAELSLSSLLSYIENQSLELDPELLKTPIVSCGGVDDKDEEIRPNFVKERSYVIDYLKKHYKDWAEYKDDLDDQYSYNKYLNPTDYKVLRTYGKNLNMLKIDSSKTISLTKMTENKPNVRLHEGSKFIRLIKDQPIAETEQKNNISVGITARKEVGPSKQTQNEVLRHTTKNVTVTVKNFTTENEIKNKPTVVRPFENAQKATRNEAEVAKNVDVLIHGNTFKQNGENVGPTIVRNINLIDKYEKKIKSKEPLDLDLLDYSEIYEPSVPDIEENLHCDFVCDNRNGDLEICNKNKEITVNNDTNYKLFDDLCTLQDFTEDAHMENAEDFYISSINNQDSGIGYYSTTFNTDKSLINDQADSTNKENVININKIYDSFTTTENDKSIADNYIDSKNKENVIKMNKNYESFTTSGNEKGLKDNYIDSTNKENVIKMNKTYDSLTTSENGNNIDHDISHKANEKSKYLTANDKCNANDNIASNNDYNGANNNDKIIHNDNNNITSQTVRDDSTNDSGFENDSTYAHSLVKIFLNELSTSYKVIYEFVNKFVSEIRGKELCDIRKNILHNQASKSLEDMVAIIQRLRSIVVRESTEDTMLKTLLLKAGVEATSDKRITRYRQVVMKCLEQAQILENALKIIVSTTIGDFDAISTNAESFNSSIRYFNIFE